MEVIEELDPNEAVALLQPGMLSVASAASVRALVIKGQTLADQGLRSPRASSDVDILVDPREFPRFIRLLADRGWWDRDLNVLSPLPDRPVAVAPHSITLVHPRFPVNVDVHRYYPGFLARPTQVFDELWARRSSNQIANLSCAVPDAVDHWLLAMLHVTRSPDILQRNELRDWLDDRTPRERRALLERATTLGAEQPLSTEFRRVGITVEPPDADTARVLVEWTARMNGDPLTGITFFTSLRDLDPRDRPRYVWRALFPPQQAVRVFYDLPHGRASLVGFYAVQLFRLSLRAPRTLIHLARRRRAASAGIRTAVEHESGALVSPELPTD